MGGSIQTFSSLCQVFLYFFLQTAWKLMGWAATSRANFSALFKLAGGHVFGQLDLLTPLPVWHPLGQQPLSPHVSLHKVLGNTLALGIAHTQINCASASPCSGSQCADHFTACISKTLATGTPRAKKLGIAHSQIILRLRTCPCLAASLYHFTACLEFWRTPLPKS